MKCPNCKHKLIVENDKLVTEDLKPECSVCDTSSPVIDIHSAIGEYVAEICEDCLLKHLNELVKPEGKIYSIKDET